MATRALLAKGQPFQEEAIWLLPVTLMAVGLFGLAQGVGAVFGLSPWSMVSAYGFKALRALPAILAFALAVQLIFAAREQPKAPLQALLRRGRNLLAQRWLVAARVMPLLLMPLVFVGFSSLKMLMPRFVPFWLDDSFAAADRILFLGYQPWELTHWLFGSASATSMLDGLYSFWVLLLSIAIVSIALFAPRTERARFFMSFTVAWLVLGVGGAWLGASAGPCYAALIGAASAPEFEGLMQRLIAMSQDGLINAPGWQQMLWLSHSNETYAFGMGISAMPSLHNAIAVLYALAAFRIGRLLGWFMTIYAVVIFVGSIHLGWHYAVDGILAAVAMLLIWKWVDRWCRVSGYDAAVAAGRSETLEEAPMAGTARPIHS